MLNARHLEAALNGLINSPESTENNRFDRATMQDMQVTNGMLIEPIEPREAVLARLNSVILPTLMDDSRFDFELLAAPDTRDTRLVRLSANNVDGSPVHAQGLIQAAIQEILKKHQRMLETHLALQTTRLTDGGSFTTANFEDASRPTRAVREPNLMSYSTTPSWPTVIMIGMLIGLLIGITAVLLRDFLQQAKQMRTA